MRTFFKKKDKKVLDAFSAVVEKEMNALSNRDWSGEPLNKWVVKFTIKKYESWGDAFVLMEISNIAKAIEGISNFSCNLGERLPKLAHFSPQPVFAENTWKDILTNLAAAERWQDSDPFPTVNHPTLGKKQITSAASWVAYQWKSQGFSKAYEIESELEKAELLKAMPKGLKNMNVKKKAL